MAGAHPMTSDRWLEFRSGLKKQHFTNKERKSFMFKRQYRGDASYPVLQTQWRDGRQGDASRMEIHASAWGAQLTTWKISVHSNKK